MEKPIG